MFAPWGVFPVRLERTRQALARLDRKVVHFVQQGLSPSSQGRLLARHVSPGRFRPCLGLIILARVFRVWREHILISLPLLAHFVQLEPILLCQGQVFAPFVLPIHHSRGSYHRHASKIPV